MQIKKLDTGELPQVCRLLTMEHIFNNIDTPFQSLYGLYALLNGMESGDIITLLLWQDYSVVGAVYGVVDDDGYFEVHAIFDRHANTMMAEKLAIEYLKKHYNIVGLRCYISVNNRHANSFARRLKMDYKGKKVFHEDEFNHYEKEV